MFNQSSVWPIIFDKFGSIPTNVHSVYLSPAYSLPLELFQVGVLQLVFLIVSSPRVTLKLPFRTEMIFLPIPTGVVIQSAGMCEISTFLVYIQCLLGTNQIKLTLSILLNHEVPFRN